MSTRSSLSNQILVPEVQTCEFDATPPAPHPPTAITVNNDTVQFQSVDVDLGMGILGLELEWNPVTGNISLYEVRLVELEPASNEVQEQKVLEIYPPEEVKVRRTSSDVFRCHKMKTYLVL